MDIKRIVEDLLDDREGGMKWLAKEIGRTYDGLRLSLTKKTIKYSDLVAVSKALEVSPIIFFEEATNAVYPKNDTLSKLKEESIKYTDLKSDLKNCKETVSVLKDQLKDKERIITLLGKK